MIVAVQVHSCVSVLEQLGTTKSTTETSAGGTDNSEMSAAHGAAMWQALQPLNGLRVLSALHIMVGAHCGLIVHQLPYLPEALLACMLQLQSHLKGH